MPLNLLGSIISGAMNAMATEKTNEMNLQIARENQAWQQQENERAFNRDLQMWDMQNQYNSPAAQRARIEAAGGNAMLAFGNGIQATSGNATNAPSLAPAKAITPTLTPYQGWNIGSNTLLDGVQKMLLLDGQLQMQDAEIGVKQQEARRLGILNDIGEGTKDYQIDQARESARKLANENDLFDQTKDYMVAKLINEVNLTDKQVKHLTALIDKINVETDILTLDRQAREILTSEEFIIYDKILRPLLEPLLMFMSIRAGRRYD